MRIKFLKNKNCLLERKCEEIMVSKNELNKKLKILYSEVERGKIRIKMNKLLQKSQNRCLQFSINHTSKK